ncbi:hypothetical protein ACLB2K_017666 [Fragaria x ananassa]
MSFYNMIPLLVFTLLQYSNAFSSAEKSQTYIILIDHSQKPSSFFTHEAWHKSILTSLMSSSSLADQENMLLYSYNHVMHGFSARLTPPQLSELEESPAHVATYQETLGKLFTTHSSKFLGLRQNSGLLLASSSGQDVIIGIINTGIWPESESFSDRGMSEVPKRWKGTCENGTDFPPFLCNNKLLGLGTARGVAPRAHVAMYKIAWDNDSDESFASDVLAGMDQAI